MVTIRPGYNYYHYSTVSYFVSIFNKMMTINIRKRQVFDLALMDSVKICSAICIRISINQPDGITNLSIIVKNIPSAVRFFIHPKRSLTEGIREETTLTLYGNEPKDLAQGIGPILLSSPCFFPFFWPLYLLIQSPPGSSENLIEESISSV